MLATYVLDVKESGFKGKIDLPYHGLYKYNNIFTWLFYRDPFNKLIITDNDIINEYLFLWC